MSRRRRGSNEAWKRKKAEAEAFMRDLKARIFYDPSRPPERVVMSRHPLLPSFDQAWDTAVAYHGELPPSH